MDGRPLGSSFLTEIPAEQTSTITNDFSRSGSLVQKKSDPEFPAGSLQPTQENREVPYPGYRPVPTQ